MPIDLSSGLVPKSGGIDLSAGLVPMQDPMAGGPTAIANRALAQASPGKGMQVSGKEQNTRALARNSKMTYADISPNGSMDVSPATAGYGGALLDAGESIAGQFKPKAMIENSPLNPMGPLRMAMGMAALPKQAGEHIGNAVNAYRDNDMYTAAREGTEGAGDTAQALALTEPAARLTEGAVPLVNAGRTGVAGMLRKGAVSNMNAVVKPSNAAFEFGREPGAAALDEGAWGFTRKGVLKDVSDALQNRTQQLQDTVNSADGTIDMRPSIHEVFDPRIDFLTKHGESAQASALQNVRDTYLDPKQWPNMGSMSPAEATEFKRDVGDLVHWSGDPLESSKADARRNLYGSAKHQINEQVPQAAALNNHVSSLITAQKALKTAVNKDAVAAPISLMDVATDAAAGPTLAVARKVLTSPGARSILAQLLNKTANVVRPGPVPNGLEVPTPPVATPPIPTFLRQPAALPAGHYEVPSAPVAGLLPESASNGMQLIPTDIQGAPHIPQYLRRLLPAGQYEVPSSPIGDILDSFHGAAPKKLLPGQYTMPASSLIKKSRLAKE